MSPADIDAFFSRYHPYERYAEYYLLMDHELGGQLRLEVDYCRQVHLAEWPNRA